ncbi:MAG: hypothetical protein EBQ92_01695, partial [Proteobacteria bacterium]|nr:hypothetical protein [Pseudomonadota bacterium]
MADQQNKISSRTLKAFEKWGEGLPDGDTKEAARSLYKKAKAGELSQTELQRLQGELQDQVNKRKAAATTKTETEPAAKETPASRTKAKPTAATEKPAPKTGAAKVKSVTSNPIAAQTAKKVAAELSAEAKPAAETAKKSGLGKAVGKYAAPAYIGANVLGRGMELYQDLGSGKTIGEALNKPESNKQVGEALLDTGLAMAGMRMGQRFGLPGSVIGGIGLPLLGKLGIRAGDVAIRGPKKQGQSSSTAPNKSETSPAPTQQTQRVPYEEIQAIADEKGIPFEDAFRQIQERQRNAVEQRAPATMEEEVRAAEPVSEIFLPSPMRGREMSEQAVKAPIGEEPDIMSFLEQPDTQQMLA